MGNTVILIQIKNNTSLPRYLKVRNPEIIIKILPSEVSHAIYEICVINNMLLI